MPCRPFTIPGGASGFVCSRSATSKKRAAASTHSAAVISSDGSDSTTVATSAPAHTATDSQATWPATACGTWASGASIRLPL